MGNSLLTVGRAFGANNLAELQKLRKLVNSNKVGNEFAHFVFNNNTTFDSVFFSKEYSKKVSTLRTLIEKFFPKSTAEGAKTIVEVIINKFGREKNTRDGAITILSVTKNRLDTGNTIKTKLLSNQAGMIFNFEGKGESGIRSNLFMYLSQMSKKTPLSDLLNKINYSEKNGVSRITINYAGEGNIRAVNGEVKGPKEFLDSFTKIITDGENPTLQDLVKSAKQ